MVYSRRMTYHTLNHCKETIIIDGPVFCVLCSVPLYDLYVMEIYISI